MNDQATQIQKIVVAKDGPYLVSGDINLVRKSQISSEHGEPMTWQTNETIDTGNQSTVALCRCGESSDKLFCDSTHFGIGFDGTETADTNSFEERKTVLEGSTGIIIKHDSSLCAESGYCGNRLTNIKKSANQTEDSTVRIQVMGMIERCPSGSYTYALHENSTDIEPDLPKQIAVTTEMSSDGPIAGPLWVTGYIPVERADGKSVETRNRVTLCRCGQSENKPYCDGTHRRIGVQE